MERFELKRLLAAEKDYDMVIIGFKNNRPPLGVQSTVTVREVGDMLSLSQEVPHPMPSNEVEARRTYIMDIFFAPSEVSTVEYYTARRLDTSGTGLVKGT